MGTFETLGDADDIDGELEGPLDGSDKGPREGSALLILGHCDARVPNTVSCGIVNHVAGAVRCRTKCRNIFICKVDKVFKQNFLSSGSNKICCRRNGEANTDKAGAECDRIHVDVYLLSNLKV